MKIELGQKVRIYPLYDATAGIEKKDFQQMTSYGEVVGINRRGRWFSVEYEAGGQKLRMSFTEDDIDEGKVILCGRRKVDKNHNRHL